MSCYSVANDREVLRDELQEDGYLLRWSRAAVCNVRVEPNPTPDMQDCARVTCVQPGEVERLPNVIRGGGEDGFGRRVNVPEGCFAMLTPDNGYTYWVRVP